MSTSLSDYRFELPEELIAQAPVEPRDTSRLFVLHRESGRFEHRSFRDFPEYFGAGDLLVANNTRVIPARFVGRRLLDGGEEGGRFECVLLEQLGGLEWETLCGSSVRQRAGIRFRVGERLVGELLSAPSPAGTVRVRFSEDPVRSGLGVIPLPPYIERAAAARDGESYQTVYAQEEGSAAAPTAGLHFTPRVLEALRERGAGWAELTLHVGLGTFRPVKTADIREHVMHEERFHLSESTAQAIASAERVCAIGTTSVRTLESAQGLAGAGRTQIFFYPGCGREFRVVDRMLTNFHLPESTLLMMISAFAGRDLVLRAYEEAVRQRYRFFSYGDAMLIL